MKKMMFLLLILLFFSNYSHADVKILYTGSHALNLSNALGERDFVGTVVCAFVYKEHLGDPMDAPYCEIRSTNSGMLQKKTVSYREAGNIIKALKERINRHDENHNSIWTSEYGRLPFLRDHFYINVRISCKEEEKSTEEYPVIKCIINDLYYI